MNGELEMSLKAGYGRGWDGGQVMGWGWGLGADGDGMGKAIVTW